MFENTNNLAEETTKFIKGENKPTLVFEMSYTNLAFILVGVIFTVVISQLIVKQLS